MEKDFSKIEMKLAILGLSIQIFDVVCKVLDLIH